MKKIVLLLLAGVALFAFIFTTSILWYRFFYNDSDASNSVSSVNVQLGDNNVIDESGLIPLDDETAKTITPYEFRVENNSTNDTTYNVLLEDTVISDDANYTNKELLSRNQLRYQLSLNGNVIKVGNLNEIENNILDTRNIASSQVNNYQLRIYVGESFQNTDWQNKYYHFNINVQMEDENV